MNCELQSSISRCWCAVANTGDSAFHDVSECKTSNYINNTISLEVFKIVQNPPLGKLVCPCAIEKPAGFCDERIQKVHQVWWRLNVWSSCWPGAGQQARHDLARRAMNFPPSIVDGHGVHPVGAAITYLRDSSPEVMRSDDVKCDQCHENWPKLVAIDRNRWLPNSKQAKWINEE